MKKEFKTSCPIFIKTLGEGSYAKVNLYRDELSGIDFAIKKVKDNNSKKDIERFYNEFELMNSSSHLNILKAYRLNKDKNFYSMEYCDFTLEDYVKKNFTKEWFDLYHKKNLAIQFLKGLKYLHEKEILHRDLSLRNILVKTFDNHDVIVKISDFGLIKDANAKMTSTGSEKRGTILDPCLENFRDYEIQNEVYSIGYILRYIFTSRQGARKRSDEITKNITEKCFDNEIEKRFKKIDEIIEEVKKLKIETVTKRMIKSENADLKTSKNGENSNDEYSKIDNKEDGLKYLLKRIIEDGDGALLHINTLDGEVIKLDRGDFEINFDNLPVRKRVFWRKVYDTMKTKKYIEDRNGRDLYYEVTEKGMRKYDGEEDFIATIL